jgi:hypothetical protein
MFSWITTGTYMMKSLYYTLSVQEAKVPSSFGPEIYNWIEKVTR